VRAQELAERAGVGKGTLYRCFRSKRELYLAAIIDGFAQLQCKLAQAMAQAHSPRQKVETIIRQTTEYFWDRKYFFVILQSVEPGSGSLYNRFYAERTKLVEMLQSTISLGIEAGELRSDLDPRLCAEALLGMVRALIRFRNRTDTPELAVQTILAIFFGGMEAKSGGREIITRRKRSG